MNYIGFPGLNLEFKINPVAFNLFGKDIYWYGIIIAFGILIALSYTLYLAKKADISSETIVDIVIYSVPVSIIFARLYYVIFSFDYYKNNLKEIFMIWNGGIAIYGGIIGAILTAYTYLKVKKLPVLKTFDVCIIGVIIGQIIGRWGNFINAEAHGAETAVLWRMSIIENGKNIFVHPTFLYESLWNLIGFIILNIMFKKKKFNGEIFLSYLAWYGTGRFFIEGMRTDSLMLGNFRISQIVAVVTVVLSLIILVKKRIEFKKPQK